VLRLGTLVDVSALTIPDLSESRRTDRQDRASETIFEELRVPRTGAFVASEGVDTLVRAIVLILQTLVNVLASTPVILQDISSSTDASIRASSTQIARVTAVRALARARRWTIFVRIQEHIRRASAFVGSFQVRAIMGASVRASYTFVHVSAFKSVLFELVTAATNTMVTTRLVHALVLATVRIILALVYI